MVAVPPHHHQAEGGEEGEHRQGHIQGGQAVAAHSRPHKEHIGHAVEGVGDLPDEGGEQVAEVVAAAPPGARPDRWTLKQSWSKQDLSFKSFL